MGLAIKRKHGNCSHFRTRKHEDSNGAAEKVRWPKVVLAETRFQGLCVLSIRKAGQSSKFTSYWRGPYKVLSKLTYLTYKVDCGPRGRPQVIHVERMRQKYPQKRREACDERSALENGQESLDIEENLI